MSLNYAPQTMTAEDYGRVFETERAIAYPSVDEFVEGCGVNGLTAERVEAAARVLSCPIKAKPPNWQHGRVLYALASRYIRDAGLPFVNVLDIGTAKGFSALMLQWALDDAHQGGQVVSVDVLPPAERVRRNTVAEVERLLTLRETLAPWPEAAAIRFLRSTGIEYLEANGRYRIHIAFVDGKHEGHVVRREGVLLAARQLAGDVAVFDDVQIPDVSRAVATLGQYYKLQYLEVLPWRQYAIGRRR